MVKHTEGDYKTTGEHHTNTIEGYWTLLKRSYIGIYHYMSPKHLQRYVDEMSYRYNTINLKDCIRFEEAVGKADNARLTYKALIGEKSSNGKKDKKGHAAERAEGIVEFARQLAT